MNKKTRNITISVVAVLILWAIGKFGSSGKETPIVNVELTQAQIDSTDRVKQFEKGKTEAIVNLRTMIQSNLNDPKSFEVLDQKGWLAGETIVVMIEYTAKNGFGGVAKSTAKAEADMNGNITKLF